MIPFLPSMMGTSNRTALYIALALLAVLAAYLYGSHRGHSQGYAEAQAIGEAKYAKLVAEYKGAQAESLANALKRNDELVAQGNRISTALITTRAELTDARAALTRRIPDATAHLSPACVFDAGFVRLWNDLLGLPAAGAAQAAGPGGAAGGAQGPAAPGAGVQPDESVATPADLLAHLRDYGQYCREAVALSSARRKLLEAWAR